jgi:hypothetical protein
MKDANQEKNADPREDYICQWECLNVTISSNSLQRKFLIFTSPTPCPRAAENEYRTFTVGVTHFVSLLSPF